MSKRRRFRNRGVRLVEGGGYERVYPAPPKGSGAVTSETARKLLAFTIQRNLCWDAITRAETSLGPRHTLGLVPGNPLPNQLTLRATE